MKLFGIKDVYLTKSSQKDDSSSAAAAASGQDLNSMTYLTKFILGCALVSLGIFVSTTGGSWDITNHLLNKPETFFSAPHAMLYSGVALAILGCAVMFRARKYMHGSFQFLNASTRLVIAGIAMLVIAGPVDFAWHSAFGLDGLLSPPHFVLLTGMIISSAGALLGVIIPYVNRDIPHLENPPSNQPSGLSVFKQRRRPYIATMLIIIAIMPIWLSLDGVVSMFSLPFSKTQYFNFNPDSSFAAVLASVGYPFLLSLILISSFRLGGNRFGILSITGSIYIAVAAITVIIPNESLISTLPFYIINLVPIVMVDVLLFVFQHRYPYSIFVAGAILGSTFFMMQYPLITHVYNEVFTKQAFVWPSITSAIYFGMIDNIYPLIVVPGVAMGIIGAITANGILSLLKLKFYNIANTEFHN